MNLQEQLDKALSKGHDTFVPKNGEYEVNEELSVSPSLKKADFRGVTLITEDAPRDYYPLVFPGWRGGQILAPTVVEGGNREKDSVGDRPGIAFLDCRGIEVLDPKVVGCGGIKFIRSTGFKFDGLIADGSHGYGVELNSCFGWQGYDSKAESSIRDGWKLTDGTRAGYLNKCVGNGNGLGHHFDPTINGDGLDVYNGSGDVTLDECIFNFNMHGINFKSGPLGGFNGAMAMNCHCEGNDHDGLAANSSNNGHIKPVSNINVIGGSYTHNGNESDYSRDIRINRSIGGGLFGEIEYETLYVDLGSVGFRQEQL